jgi:hypothetical protein
MTTEAPHLHRHAIAMPLKFQDKVKTPKQKIIVFFFALTGPLFLLGSTNDELKHRRLIANGVKTTGKVVDSYIEHPSKGPDRAVIKVSYQAAGAKHQNNVYMDGDSYEMMDNPGTLPVIYARDAPDNVELLDGGSDAWLGILSGLGMTVIGFWGIAPSFRKKKVDLSKPTD